MLLKPYYRYADRHLVTSTSSFGSGISPAAADVKSTQYVADNTDLQWSEGSYRGFFTLTIDTNKVNATFWAMRNTSASPPVGARATIPHYQWRTC